LFELALYRPKDPGVVSDQRVDEPGMWYYLIMLKIKKILIYSSWQWRRTPRNNLRSPDLSFRPDKTTRVHLACSRVLRIWANARRGCIWTRSWALDVSWRGWYHKSESTGSFWMAEYHKGCMGTNMGTVRPYRLGMTNESSKRVYRIDKSTRLLSPPSTTWPTNRTVPFQVPSQ
jgi:hypothetical protein